jgi:hypothetical protein
MKRIISINVFWRICRITDMIVFLKTNIFVLNANYWNPCNESVLVPLTVFKWEMFSKQIWIRQIFGRISTTNKPIMLKLLKWQKEVISVKVITIRWEKFAEVWKRNILLPSFHFRCCEKNSLCGQLSENNSLLLPSFKVILLFHTSKKI